MAIVTPCLNVVGAIDQTIQSVISQAGGFSIRYHVQDGGSTDGTLERLKHWEKALSGRNQHVKCRGVVFTWSSKSDQGMYDAILNGFNAMDTSPSEFMTWINGDDILLPNALAAISRIASDLPEIEWIGSPNCVIDRDGRIIAEHPNLIPSDFIREGLCDGRDFHWPHLQQEGTFFRNSLWRRAKHVLTGYRLAGDWALWREFARHAEYYQFERSLGAFRQRDGQLSVTRRGDYHAEVEATLPMKKRDEAFQRLHDQSGKLQANVLRAGPGGVMGAEKRDVAKKFAKEEAAKPVSARPSRSAVARAASGNGQDMTQERSILGYDAEWQDSDITEQHAYAQALKFLPEVPGIMYFGFPWATLIEHRNSRTPIDDRLTDVLASARPLLAGQKHVITVCQHKDLLKHQQLFAEAGITHVFWPHAVQGQDCLPDHKNIKIFPFPFFSDQAAPSVVRRIPEESPFFLCATGPCSNSARLWEAIGCGSIPVVLPDAFLPGNQALWEEAAVFCSERLEDVRALPDRLEALARDEALLERKRHALRQLWMLYGPDCFIYDIQTLFLSLAAETADGSGTQPDLPYGRLLGMAAEINRNGAAESPVAGVFILGCGSRVLIDPSGFSALYKENEQFRLAYRRAMGSCGGNYAESMRKALDLRGVALDDVTLPISGQTSNG